MNYKNKQYEFLERIQEKLRKIEKLESAEEKMQLLRTLQQKVQASEQKNARYIEYLLDDVLHYGLAIREVIELLERLKI